MLTPEREIEFRKLAKGGVMFSNEMKELLEEIDKLRSMIIDRDINILKLEEKINENHSKYADAKEIIEDHRKQILECIDSLYNLVG